MCARAIDMRGEGKRRGPSAELHRYRLNGRSWMGPCRQRWRKYKRSASGGNGAGRGGALLLWSSAPSSTYRMVVTAPVLKFNGWLKLVALSNIELQGVGREREEREGEEKRRTTSAHARLICVLGRPLYLYDPNVYSSGGPATCLMSVTASVFQPPISGLQVDM